MIPIQWLTSALISLDAYRKSQDLDWTVTLEFWSCLRLASHVHAHHVRKKKAHYCLCRLNLRRLSFKHTLCLKGYSRYCSNFSHITAAASPAYSAFPKCSLTLTSALPAIQPTLVQGQSLSYRSWKNILRIKFSHQNLRGIQFSRNSVHTTKPWFFTLLYDTVTVSQSMEKSVQSLNFSDL